MQVCSVRVDQFLPQPRVRFHLLVQCRLRCHPQFRCHLPFHHQVPGRHRLHHQGQRTTAVRRVNPMKRSFTRLMEQPCVHHHVPVVPCLLVPVTLQMAREVCTDNQPVVMDRWQSIVWLRASTTVIVLWMRGSLAMMRMVALEFVLQPKQ